MHGADPGSHRQEGGAREEDEDKGRSSQEKGSFLLPLARASLAEKGGGRTQDLGRRPSKPSTEAEKGPGSTGEGDKKAKKKKGKKRVMRGVESAPGQGGKITVPAPSWACTCPPCSSAVALGSLIAPVHRRWHR